MMERVLGSTSRAIMRIVAIALALGQIALITWLIVSYGPARAGDQIAPLIGVVGSGVAAAVAIFGLLVRESMEFQAEERLNLEAAVEAVKLLTTDDGSRPATTVQIGGALLALIDLGRLSLALTLLDELWPHAEGLVSPNVASTVVGKGLRSSDHARTAAATLIQNAEKTFPTDGDTVYMPEPIYEWPLSMPLMVRRDCVTYLAKTASHIATNEHSIRTKQDMFLILRTTYEAGTVETDRPTRAKLRRLLRTLVPAFPDLLEDKRYQWIAERGETYTAGDLTAFAEAEDTTLLGDGEQYFAALGAWADTQPFVKDVND